MLSTGWKPQIPGIVLTLLLTTHVLPLQAQTRADDDPHSAVVQRLRAAIEHEVELKQLPALSISLVADDDIFWSAGFGFQDAARNLPASANTIYRVGSVSKLFTDIAVLQLVEQGQLDLDVPLQTWLPEFQPHNPFGTPLTLRQLMSHRAGLVRESPVGHYFDPTEPTLVDTVASLNQTQLVYAPETRTKYSNAAIAVVGAVLQEQLDVPHPQRIREALLEPLGMTDSSFEPTPATQGRLATGWMWTYDGRRFEAPRFQLGTGPAGNLYASMPDLARFLVCVFHNGTAGDRALISPQTLQLMTTPLKDKEGRDQDFGLGFHIRNLDGHREIGHGGAIYGFSTQLEAIPERRLGVAASASLDGANGVVRKLTDYALRLMLAQQDGRPLPDYRTTINVAPDRAQSLAGTWQSAHASDVATPAGQAAPFVHVTQHGDQLWMQKGTFRMQVRADSTDGTLVTDDAPGGGTRIVVSPDGRVLIDGVPYDRAPDTPPAEIPQRWQGLIGEYGHDHNVLYILEDQGQLFALIEWFYYYPLTQISDDEYRFPDDGLYHGEGLRFERDSAGNATRVRAAEVLFERREIGTRDGATFRITPVRPIEELRAEALQAVPPDEPSELLVGDLAEIVQRDPSIRLDIRYATTNNFTGAIFYQQPRAFLQQPAAAAVVRVQQRLEDRGLGLLIHDAYRP